MEERLLSISYKNWRGVNPPGKMVINLAVAALWGLCGANTAMSIISGSPFYAMLWAASFSAAIVVYIVTLVSTGTRR